MNITTNPEYVTDLGHNRIISLMQPVDHRFDGDAGKR